MLAFTCNVRGATPLGQPLLPGTDEPTAIPARDAVAPAVNPVARLRPRIFYGWWIVAGGFVIQGLNGGLLFHAFSAYILPLQAEFGWNRSLLSGAFSMAQAEGGILGPLQGWLIERFGPRGVMRVGLTVFGVGFLLFSRMDSIAMFYASFAMMAIGSGLGTFLPVATTITNWFRQGLKTHDVMTLAGHANFETTHKFYLAVADDLISRARDASTHEVSRELLEKCRRNQQQEIAL